MNGKNTPAGKSTPLSPAAQRAAAREAARAAALEKANPPKEQPAGDGQGAKVSGQIVVNGQTFPINAGGASASAAKVPEQIKVKELLSEILALAYELAQGNVDDAVDSLGAVLEMTGFEVSTDTKYALTEALKGGSDDVSKTTTTGEEEDTLPAPSGKK